MRHPSVNCEGHSGGFERLGGEFALRQGVHPSANREGSTFTARQLLFDLSNQVDHRTVVLHLSFFQNRLGRL